MVESDEWPPWVERGLEKIRRLSEKAESLERDVKTRPNGDYEHLTAQEAELNLVFDQLGRVVKKLQFFRG